MEAGDKPAYATKPLHRGTAGTAVQILANYFALQRLKHFPEAADHYDVTFKSASHGKRGVRGVRVHCPICCCTHSLNRLRPCKGMVHTARRSAAAPSPAGPVEAAAGTTAAVATTSSAAAAGHADEANREDLPPRLAFRIMSQLARDERWPAAAWAFDGRKNLFVPEELLPPPGELLEFRVELSPEQAAGGGRVKSKIFTVVDVVLRHPFNLMKDCLICGRSMIFTQNKPTPISKNMELISGVKQASTWVAAEGQQNAGRGGGGGPPVVGEVKDAYGGVDARQVAWRSQGSRAPGWWGAPPRDGGADLPYISLRRRASSFKAVESGLALNLDTTFGAFLAPARLGDLLGEAWRRGPREFVASAKGLIGTKVEFKLPNGAMRRKAIRGFSEAGADNTKFWNEEKQR
ncbi:hypothetical protein VOLCADRAFT_92638 [Volvox carteri f. nagariensis]|uniref:Uncharacterized protein n=1 Tax=Volvox carteri f. nagariensis TaxID=3068 RepID=D8U062_VOLCA|nr:uncharacterized protein VOLCADRAFT_92638 [Volvox carteri f. nagariensis]EFJ46882.1 hypothetical protein VOLCADRAFT_92638 [Volvox carteri f. nagariensis]|eukprot:XP_002952091.1 hypothetical protein VOLCADRAFT_92638 [Volvox carteri f. nagariensis]